MPLIRKLLFSLLAIIGIHTLAIEINIPESEVINICVEDTGWPPFSILEAKNDKSSPILSGKNSEFLEYIFKKHNLTYNIHIKPWKRCLHEGINGNIQIVLDAASNEQRQKDYLLTTTVYELTPVFVYLPKRYNSPLKLLTQKELRKLGQGCGQTGYIYNNFGFRNDELNLQAKDLQNLLSLVSKKRCAFGLARLEVYKYEKDLYSSFRDVEYGNIQDAQNESFHWLINKKYRYASQLKTIIDNEIHSKNFVFSTK